MEKQKVLFVCTGNICRSPTAHGIFEQLLVRHQLQSAFAVDSAAISDYHTGEAPDPRTQKIALARGIDLSAQRARQIRVRDFYEFHFIVAMDSGHLEELQAMAPDDGIATVMRLLDVCDAIAHKDVPDPYYGQLNGFERVFDICEAGCNALLQRLRQ